MSLQCAPLWRKQGASSNVLNKIDLHCHTTASDGKLSPKDLLEKAHGLGITTLAITDHDTVAGFREALPVAQKLGVQLVPGIELSCVWAGITIHIVGLNFDPEAPAMKAAEQRQIDVRYQRAKLIAEKVGKRLKHDININDVAAYAGGEQIGRPHFAQYMVENGLVPNMAAAFTRYLGAGKVGDVKTGWPSMSEAVQWIINSGGTAVMAHAHRYKMTRTKLKACITDFVQAGGRAIEVAYSSMDPGQQQQMVQFAQEFNLKGSCGSDYHGPNRFGLELGHMPKFPSEVTPVWSDWALETL